VGVIPNIEYTVSLDLKAAGNSVYIIGETYNEFGGSEYYRLQGYLVASVPKVHGGKAKRTFKAVTKAIDAGLVKACHDLSEGGLAVAAAEMAFAGGLGLQLDLRRVPGKDLVRNDFVLFSESNSRFLIEVAEGDKEDFEVLMHGKGCIQIGVVTKEPKFVVYGLDGKVIIDVSVEALRRSWKQTLNPEEAS
jgi:phosphoribosylformylglycinamidine synthase